MPLSLPEALARFHAVSDTTHKFWGYFRVVAGGAVAFAWTSQREANVLAEFVRETHFAVVPPPNALLAEVYADRGRSMDASSVWLMHTVISFAALVAIAWRCCIRCGCS